MKTIVKSILLVIILALVLPMEVGQLKAEPIIKDDFRGIWVATVLNIDYPKKPATNPDILKEEAIEVLDNAKTLGIDAVFFQVRPCGDALYNSKLYPWSKYLTGKQGQAPEEGFDPLMFWVTEAHKRGIELHAWINPYRVTKKTVTEIKHDFASLDPLNPAVIHPDWVIKHSDGNLYLNPGLPEVRKYIIDGVFEIIENYGVDGIHMDDYFYPGKNFDDTKTYKKYGNDFEKIDDWRRENVNIFIRELYQAIKLRTEGIRFGVSPFGIWANEKSNPLGSDTNGAQSYYEHYADTRKWVKEGIIDYIVPQLYWNIGFKVADYEKLMFWWADVVKNTKVDLYIGQAAYKVQNTDSQGPWCGEGEIEKQFNLNAQIPEVKGSILYNYSSVVKNQSLFNMIQAYNKKKNELKEPMPILIGMPGKDVNTKFDNYYICGASDPDKPLWLNGKRVENRSDKGYFGILVALGEGDNVFTFTQARTSASITITRQSSSYTPVKMDEPMIDSVFPQKEEFKMTGEKITLSCKAPIGAKVDVTIAGKSYAMNPATVKPLGEGIFSTTYSYTYTIPSYGGNPRNINLGNPTYKMNYKGIVKTIKAPEKIGAIMKMSPFFAEVISDDIYTYSQPNSGSGGIHELQKGMVDYITGITGNYVRLAMGHWVDKSKVKIFVGKSNFNTKIDKAEYTPDKVWEKLKLYTEDFPLVIADYENDEIKLVLSGLSRGVLPKIAEDGLLSGIEVRIGEYSSEYKLKLKEEISGYYIEKTSDGIILNIRKVANPQKGDNPLAGITIMLDPGHGGDSLGAVGPLGKEWAEKVINLRSALKLKNELEGMGAVVLMTRTEDVDISLEERLKMSKAAKPDLFISIHANSMESNIDISKVAGFSIFYRDAHSLKIAKEIHDSVVEGLGRDDKGIHKQKFYVFRGTWSPSILIESGFVPNPYEFQWLVDEDEQNILVKNFARAILDYYTNKVKLPMGNDYEK